MGEEGALLSAFLCWNVHIASTILHLVTSHYSKINRPTFMATQVRAEWHHFKGGGRKENRAARVTHYTGCTHILPYIRTYSHFTFWSQVKRSRYKSVTLSLSNTGIAIPVLKCFPSDTTNNSELNVFLNQIVPIQIFPSVISSKSQAKCKAKCFALYFVNQPNIPIDR